MSKPKNKSVLTGITLTAGSAIGAGMFSLPVVSSGMWFILSVVSLLFLCFLSYLSALYLLEVNVQFSPGASFDTLVKNTLGNKWNIITGLSIAFLLYILMYAYFSAFSSIAPSILDWEIFEKYTWTRGLSGLLLGFFLGVIVWLSTKFVGRISTLLVIGMIITFLFSMSGLAIRVEAVKLFNVDVPNSSYMQYIWAALPYYITSFAFSAIVPSLYKYYGKNSLIIRKGIFLGLVITLIVYCLFLFVAFGNISREAFVAINKAGGNMGQLVNALEQSENSIINIALNMFSNFAVITSFLGAGLGLFDYIADKFSFVDDAKGRFYTAAITFLLPGIASFFFPNGFIAAIGFAGLVLIFSFFVVPYLMVKKTRKTKQTVVYRVWGGNLLLNCFFISSVCIAVFHILGMLNYLPKW